MTKKLTENAEIAIELLNNLPDAMVALTPEGKVVYWNKGAENTFGYSRAEAVGKELSELIIPIDPLAKEDNYFKEVMDSGYSAFEAFRKRKDGSLIHVDISTRAILDDQGRVKYLISSKKDITKRMRAEERYRLVVEAAPSPMMMVDALGRMVLANTQVEQLFGYTRAELLKQPVEMLVPEQYAGIHPSHRTGFFQHPKSRAMGAGRDLYGRRKDGIEVPIEIGLNPVKTPEGLFVLVSIVNITERKRGEESLRSSEVRYRRLFESAEDGILILEADNGRIIDVNPYLLELLGATKDELMGHQLWELGPFKDIAASKIAFEELQQRGYTRYEDLPLEDRDGTIRQVEFVSNSYLSGEKRVIQCNIRDITERKRVEERLHLQSAALEAAANAIIITDAKGEIIWVNPAFTRTTGYTAEEAVGQTPRLIKSGKQDRAFYKQMWGTILSGEVWHNTIVNRRKDGTLNDEDLTITPITNADAKITNFIGIKQDITELKRTESALMEANDRFQKALTDLHSKSDELAAMTQQLWQASKLATMGELAASVAHELNNPLATLALHAESLLDQLRDGDPKRGAVEVIAQEVERMASLVSNLLIFSRRSHRQISTVNLCEEIVNSLDFIRYHLRSHKIDIVKDFAGGLPTVQADQQQLRQVFLNLITNASDAMPKGGTLTVRSRAGVMAGGQPAVVVEFSDTGTGISTGDLPKLWEPFFTTKPEGKGTGLGLGICRRTVEEHRGTIEIETAPWKGTTVRITLPATEAGIEVAA